jgi:hypothetical protein
MTLCLQFESNMFLDLLLLLLFGVFCFLLYLVLLLDESKKFNKLGDPNVGFLAKHFLKMPCAQMEIKHMFSFVGVLDSVRTLLFTSGKHGLNYYYDEKLT